MNNIRTFIDQALVDKPIADTKSFTWLVTPFGIAALCKNKRNISEPPFDEAVKEGIQVSIDLSREETEFYDTEKGLLLLFYS